MLVQFLICFPMAVTVIFPGNHRIFPGNMPQRPNKRIIKIVLLLASAILLLGSAHLAAVRVSHQYSALSSNVLSVLSDYLVDRSSYLYKDFLFQGTLPEGVSTEEQILAWNQLEYQREMDKGPDPDLKYTQWHENYQRRKDSAFVVQVSNKDLPELIKTIGQLEASFNSRFQYPYVFLNVDGKYSDRFHSAIKQVLPGREVFFELVDPEDLRRPAHIDKQREQNGLGKLKTEGLVPLMNVNVLKNLFRYFSNKMFFHPRLLEYKYYWRFEPGTKYHTVIDYDVFQFMADNDKTYGFTLATYEYDPATVEGLFPSTLKFLSSEDNMRYLHANNSKGFLMENLVNPSKTEDANGYSTCHFWSSFEVADMDFFRGPLYQDYYNYLDETGGFYYDRWGDGPVHTLALTLFEDRKKLHWFNDIGFEQFPFTNCPLTAGDRCEAHKFSDNEFQNLNCIPMWVGHGGDGEVNEE